MPHHFDWLEFRSSDNQATREFYSRAFGWEFHDFSDGYIYALPGGKDEPGAGFRENPPAGTPQTVAYINTRDIDDSLSAVKAAGGEVVLEKTEMPEVGWMAFFKDPSGNIVGLHQFPDAK